MRYDHVGNISTMAIRFAPSCGDILICDFGAGFMPPEMVKRRPVLILSPRLRGREGLCTVAPLSTTPPQRPVAYQCAVTLPAAPPKPFSQTDLWAKADMLATVSFSRLDLFRSARQPNGRRNYLKMALPTADLEAVRDCVIHALGLQARLTR